ncbi:MAG TPA: NTP transferase domain-containing protein [Myxococcota bacterium]|nr:NTP transferase domain-containing protein [Myxococcota bacterium]
MRPGAIVQARSGSTRLPAKVLADLGGRPLLWHVVSRLRAARSLSFIGVATTADPSDDALAAFCEAEGIPCVRGAVDDVLGRLVQAAETWGLDPVVRISGDCPFVDARVVDDLVAAHRRADADYTTYATPVVHEGIDPFSLRWLRRTHRRRLPADEREHPLLALRRRPHEARIVTIPPDPAAAPRPGLRLSVDEPADLAFARAVYAALARPDAGDGFGTSELLALVDARPDLVALNAHVPRAVPKGIA